jgi:hypothetical protein
MEVDRVDAVAAPATDRDFLLLKDEDDGGDMSSIERNGGDWGDAVEMLQEIAKGLPNDAPKEVLHALGVVMAYCKTLASDGQGGDGQGYGYPAPKEKKPGYPDAGMKYPAPAAKDAFTAAVLAVPHEEWFGNPTLPGPTPLTISDDGRIFGHAALKDTCHIGYTDQCLTPPMGSDYRFFMTGSVKCVEGCEIPTGAITLGTGHAPLAAGAQEAARHYDDSGSAVADVATGEDEYGIWFSGMIRPGTTDEQIHALRASSLSGDWRRISGRLELVGLLAVNVPGFPVPRSLAASAKSLRPTAYVIEGETCTLIGAGAIVQPDPLVNFMEDMAERISKVEERERRAAVRERLIAIVGPRETA